MCIVYFASHSSCTHNHLIGAWNCGLNCPTDSHNTFYLDEGGYDCSTCQFLGGEELDPDIVPVQYYPPLFDPAEDQREKEEEALYTEDHKALSDADSETGFWCAGGDAYAKPKGGGHKAASENITPHKMTPRKAAHKSLVRRQLKELPKQVMPVHFQPMGHVGMLEPMAQTVGDGKFWIPAAQGGVGKKW
ncbi:hypothetical protein BDU57DRAFT_534460 [Ampelomyces quisqualis]|uniref:Uncharacterized protein n=1 Tax=Ampelomyces quisqualis TaxID=50730 RepID=A0A6A5R417_AMPQU|nr:hypothetical protein BDU57DRAFT_534460 [Ampelomyces quisqualis]